MADHQRIHPVAEPEAQQKPTAPLVSQGFAQSEKGDPEVHYPPFQYTLGLQQSKPPKKRSCFRRCLCWTICLLLLQIIILGILAAIIFLVFQPKIPKYSIDSIRIAQLSLNNDMSLYASINVNITARNPNKRIGIYYENGSNLRVQYQGTQLCEGSLPKFYQGHRNTTLLNVNLMGETQNASYLLASLQAQQQTGSVPLNVRVKVPVRIKLGSLKLMKWNFLLRCRLVVDTLAPDNVIRIRDNSCKFRFRL